MQKETHVKICAQCGYENLPTGKYCASCGARLPIATETRLVEAPVEYAGFWRRFVAWIIDQILLGIVLAPIAYIIPKLYENGFGALFDVAYTVGFWTWKSQTPGKMALGIRIVTIDGEPIGFGRSILRYFGMIVASLPLGLGLFWIGWDRKKQGWHDKIAGTYVIKY